MDRNAFLKRLAARFYPVLRAEGFKGSGTALRRHDGDFHHIVAVQASAGGAGCYLNLGAHIDFLPAEGGGAFPAKRAILPGQFLAGNVEMHPGAVVDVALQELGGGDRTAMTAGGVAGTLTGLPVAKRLGANAALGRRLFAGLIILVAAYVAAKAVL